MLYDTYLDLPLTLTHLLFCPNPKYISYTILLLKPLQSAFFDPYTQKLKTHPNTTQPPPPPSHHEITPKIQYRLPARHLYIATVTHQRWIPHIPLPRSYIF